MKKSRFYTLLAILTFVAFEAQSQQVTWGEDPRSNSTNSYFMTVGENESGIYMLSHSSRKEDIARFAIERYNHDLFFQNSKSIKQRGQKLLRIQILKENVFFALGPISKKAGTQTVTGYLLDEKLDGFARQIPLMTLNVKSRSQDYFFKVRNTPDFNQIGVFGFIDSPQETGKVLYYNLFNEDLDTVLTHTFFINYKFEESDVSDVYIDNKGNFYMTIEHSNNSKKIGEGRYVTDLVYCNLSQDKFVHIPIAENGFMIKGVGFTSDDSMNVVFANGFFGAEINGYQKGVFQIGVDQLSGEIRVNTFTDIPISFVGEVLGEKNLNQGSLLSQYYIKKIVRTTENKSILIAERYYSDIYSDQVWMNGAPITVSHRLYHYDEVILICLDTLGKITWNQVIQKQQTSQDDYGYFSSILVAVTPDLITILYNDRMNKSKDVLQYTITKEGEIKSEILFPAEQVYTYIIPVEGRQTGYNRLVVPILRERDYSIIKLTYNKKSNP